MRILIEASSVGILVVVVGYILGYLASLNETLNDLYVFKATHSTE